MILVCITSIVRLIEDFLGGDATRAETSNKASMSELNIYSWQFDQCRNPAPIYTISSSIC